METLKQKKHMCKGTEVGACLARGEIINETVLDGAE